VEKVDRARLEVVVDYDSVDALMRRFNDFEAVVEGKEYGERIEFLLAVPTERADALREAVAGITKGKGTVRPI
jgi:putative IMPACT (imprinted ancient) family translation regulator